MYTRKKVIFADIAGTLGFHSKHNSIQDRERISEHLIRAFDPFTNAERPAFDIAISDYKMYFDPKTLELLEQLKQQFTLVYVTGARPSSIEALRPVLTPADAIILESGAVIYHDGITVDQEWERRIGSERNVLNGLRDTLRVEGWILDDQGRTSAVRIFPENNPGKTMADFQSLAGYIAVAHLELKTTWNTGGFDIIPRSAGKGSAVEYFRQVLGCELVDTIGLGDDINDIELFVTTGRQYVVRSFHQEILALAAQNRWHVSSAAHFDGVNELLKTIMEWEA